MINCWGVFFIVLSTARGESTNDGELSPNPNLTSSRLGSETRENCEDGFCDGGWTVFQKRIDGSVDFNRTWYDYKYGFGQRAGEFWLGLDRIHGLTKYGGCRLRIDLWDFNDESAYALYSDFSVADEGQLYRVKVGGYSGTAGDSLNYSYGGLLHADGQPFTTWDTDNDNYYDNCANPGWVGTGGWWYNQCSAARLNAEWGVPGMQWWHTWKGGESLARSIMKLRCD